MARRRYPDDITGPYNKAVYCFVFIPFSRSNAYAIKELTNVGKCQTAAFISVVFDVNIGMDVSGYVSGIMVVSRVVLAVA